MKTLELYYPMTQFLKVIISCSFQFSCNLVQSCIASYEFLVVYQGLVKYLISNKMSCEVLEFSRQDSLRLETL